MSRRVTLNVTKKHWFVPMGPYLKYWPIHWFWAATWNSIPISPWMNAYRNVLRSTMIQEQRRDVSHLSTHLIDQQPIRPASSPPKTATTSTTWSRSLQVHPSTTMSASHRNQITWQIRTRSLAEVFHKKTMLRATSSTVSKQKKEMSNKATSISSQCFKVYLIWFLTYLYTPSVMLDLVM